MSDIDDDANELYLHYKTDFKATRIIDAVLYPTNFTLESDVWFDMDNVPAEDRDYTLNLILMKIDFFYKNIIDNSIMFGDLNEWAIPSLLDNNTPRVDNILVRCPFQPSDDHLAMLFQSKMNALGNGNLVFGAVTVSSDNSRGLSFTFVGDGAYCLPDISEWIGERSFFENPWWDRNDSSSMDIVPKEDDDLTIKPEFAFDLDFLGESLKPNKTEIYTNNVIKPKFKPYVVKNDE